MGLVPIRRAICDAGEVNLTSSQRSPQSSAIMLFVPTAFSGKMLWLQGKAGTDYDWGCRPSNRLTCRLWNPNLAERRRPIQAWGR